MSTPPSPERPWPARDLDLKQSIIGFFEFLHTTSLTKVAGLTEDEARRGPVSTSPVLSPLGLIKHLTAVQRQHVQRHIGGSELPLLWNHEDTTADFRVGAGETIASVLDAFDAEWQMSKATLQRVDWDDLVEAYGRPVRVGRLVVDVLQESARHVGHLDIVRELIDGTIGE